ncbi:PQQ-binding-like beta-propeller repeat protein [Natronobiforma cellulositropha]|uniref:PQQ-binding-like beta-propeller repeat protein n=1 Tax=Natronobiforma cellulositropha TaxID=1679076 RepID=UPI0021D5A39E|nr:PQQ-binding-like beta-propeller repeat protein [Natronobiforma cellulositropha]
MRERADTPRERSEGQRSGVRECDGTDHTGLSRRRVLQAAGLASVGTVGLAGCTALRSSGTYDPDQAAFDPPVRAPEESYLENATMFRGGLRRLGYYPDETVPEAVRVDWQLPVNYVRHNAAKASPVPTPDGGTVVIPADTGRVHAVSPRGEFRWTLETAATVQGFHASPIVVDGVAYVGDYGGADRGNTASMHAIDTETGEHVWEADGFDSAVAIGSSAAYWDGYLYVVCEYRRTESGALYVLDAETGDELWSDHRIDGMPHPTVAIDPAAERLLTGSNDGVCYCWEFPSLEFEWGFQTGGEIKGPIATHDGGAFVGSWDGSVYRVSLADGTEEWSFETENIVMSAPAVDPEAGIVYVGSDDWRVYALETDTGDEVWSRTLDGRVMSAVSVTADAVLAGTNGNSLYALEKDTGEVRWRVTGTGDATSEARVHDGRIYYAERAALSNEWDDDPETTVLEAPGHAYCLVADE